MSEAGKRERWQAQRERTSTPGIWKMTRRDGTVVYRVVVDLGKHPATGRRDQRVSTHDTLKAARAERSRLLADRNAGTLVLPDRALTLRKACDDWLAGRRNLSPKTYRGYADALDTACLALGAMPVQDIDVAALNRMVAAMESGELRRRQGPVGKPLGPRSVQNVLSRVQQVLDYLVRQGKLVRNVATLVERPPLPERGDHAWTPDEARTFARHAATDRLAACWLLSLLGLRRGEVLGLVWAAIDLDAGALSVAKSKTRSGVRTLPLPGVVADALRAHRARLAAERLAAGEAYTVTDRLAVDPLGVPVHPDWYSAEFRRLAKAARVRVIRPHDARHTAATLLRQAGVHPEVAAKWLGHSRGSITMTLYTDDPREAAMADAGSRLADVLGIAAEGST